MWRTNNLNCICPLNTVLDIKKKKKEKKYVDVSGFDFCLFNTMHHWTLVYLHNSSHLPPSLWWGILPVLTQCPASAVQEIQQFIPGNREYFASCVGASAAPCSSQLSALPPLHSQLHDELSTCRLITDTLRNHDAHSCPSLSLWSLLQPCNPLVAALEPTYLFTRLESLAWSQ